jgi:hypothetical protein
LVERDRDYGPHNTFDGIMLAARVLRREALREVALFSTQFQRADQVKPSWAMADGSLAYIRQLPIEQLALCRHRWRCCKVKQLAPPTYISQRS